VRTDLPTGTVTFLFTDIEGSTALLHALGETGYAEALGQHRALLRASFALHQGVEVDTQGDAFFVAFANAQDAVAAAETAQRALEEGPIRVRMGLHTGSPHLGSEGYVGTDVHLGARVAAAGHGGQVLLTEATRGCIDVPVTDLGEHRLKDFAAPVPIYQLGLETFPPLKTISNTNLPRPASSFVGREAEVARVVALVRESRLVTLTGPGGTGKSRLAIEAAGTVVGDFKAGVFWVPLAPVRDPALVLTTIGQVLGAKGEVAEHVGQRDMLLVLDNVEQVVDAAARLAVLLEACPRLRMLVTSRELLTIRGEAHYPVPPLATTDATQLFCARSGAAPDQPVGELCARLDNLPLAIELAAARARVLTPTEILDRLGQRLDLLVGGRDSEPRQRTLRTTIEWSHDLLTPEERRLFARLAVFAGGCTVKTAAAVIDADLEVLQSLVDKSLLVHTAGRFWMLATIHEFARERFVASEGADQLRHRYADHFLAVAEQAEPHTREFQAEAEWLDLLETELDNLRAALDILEAVGDGTRQLRMTNALSAFWGHRGFLAEGSQRIQRALEAAPEPTLHRARALNRAADLGGLAQGDADAVERWAGQALALFRDLDEPAGAADALFMLGHAAADHAEFELARERAEESLRLYDSLEDRQRVAISIWLLGWAYAGLGDTDRAMSMYDDALGRARAEGMADLQSLTLYSLSGHLVNAGKSAEAVPLVAEAYRLARADGNQWRLALTGCRLARVLVSLDRPAEAARLFASASALLEQMGGRAEHRAEEDDEILSRTREELDDAALLAATSLGRATPLLDAIDLALTSVRGPQGAHTPR
jgi:predicted ATPase